MILRRMMEHVRTQNWLAVALDFVIVVLGVFIGIQVANWNEARGERQRERQALELLLKEAENNTAYAKLIIYRADRLRRDREAAQRLLHGQAPGDGDPVSGLSVMSVFRDMTPISAAYDQLSASGDMTLVGSAEVRNILSLYNGVIVFHDRMRNEYIDRAPDIMAMASPYMELRYDAELPLGYTATVDWQAAGQDRALVNAINRVMGDQVVFSERREIIRGHARQLCDALARELERECAPPDWIADEIARETAP